MKKILAIFLILVLSLCMCTGCLETSTDNQGSGSADAGSGSKSNLGNYNVVIDSCRLAEDYSGNPIIIIKYVFTNNDEEAASFMWSVSEQVYQDGIELEHCYLADDSANYSSENQNKNVKQGVSITVEVAYTLNNTTSNVEVEVSELISLNNKKVVKTFRIS